MLTRNGKQTKEQKDLRKNKFEEGMQACGQATLGIRQAAAAETGLAMGTICVYI